MPTVIENVQKEGFDLLVQGEIFLYVHSTIESGKWGDLEEVGLQEQARLLQKCDAFFSVLKTLLSGQAGSCRKEVETANAGFRELIAREKPCAYESIDAAVQAAKKGMHAALNGLSRLYDGKSGEVCYVPDTSALLHNTQLDAWQFEGVPAFTMVLTPNVLSELDELKARENDRVQPKAETVVRQIEEYARRGDLSQGVTLGRGWSTLRSLPTEPDMAHTQSWLDAGSKHDRFIASSLEVMRHHPCCEVVLVTRDAEVRDKAKLASLPVIAPPEPSA